MNELAATAITPAMAETLSRRIDLLAALGIAQAHPLNDTAIPQGK